MTVVVVDDHPLLGLGLALGLKSRGVDAIAVEPIESQDPVSQILGLDVSVDLVVTDLMMPAVKDTAELVARMTSYCPVVVLTGSDDLIGTGKCLEAGALGILNKNEPIDRIIEDILGVLATGNLRPSARIERLQTLDAHRRLVERETAAFRVLTSAERTVLAMLCDGFSAMRIAEERFVSLPTVRTQIKAVLSKLDAASQLEAVAIAHRLGFDPDAATT